MEFIDIYDEDMNYLGYMEKEQAHKEKHWHKSVHICVGDSENNILVQRRASCKSLYPGLWDFSVSGHISSGETPLQGAIREFQEELGLPWEFGEIKESFINKITLSPDGHEHNEFVYVYLLKKKIDLSKLNLQTEEVAEVKCISLGEFTELFNSGKFVPHRESYIKEVINGLSRLTKGEYL